MFRPKIVDLPQIVHTRAMTSPVPVRIVEGREILDDPRGTVKTWRGCFRPLPSYISPRAGSGRSGQSRRRRNEPGRQLGGVRRRGGGVGTKEIVRTRPNRVR